MKIKVSLTIITILLIATVPVSATSIEKPNLSQYKNDIPQLIDCYIIEGVPYVSQETNLYCAYATVTMILQYYGIDTNLKEILHHSGIGYVLFYSDLFYLFEEFDDYYYHATYFRYPLSGLIFCQYDRAGLADMFNLTYLNWSANQNECSIEKNWDEYWLKVKENVTQDVPVITSVNISYMPYTDETSGHSIVIVGFNQTHVFYNDPATALYSNPESGYYANISIEDFKNAVNSTPATKFKIDTFHNTSNICYDRTEVFLKAHKRNIEKLKGVFYGADMYFFGINAARMYRLELRVGPLRRMITVSLNWDYVRQDGLLNASFNLLSLERLNVSQYLIENQDLSKEICTHDGSLLENESKCWKKITECITELQNISKKHGRLLTLILSFSITRKIRAELNKIILIQKALIKGPSSILSVV